MLSLIFIVIAAVANAAADANFNMFYQSIFSDDKKFNKFFWNPYESWINKWKNKDRAQGERFFGSSTFLVFLTDSWHFFKSTWLVSLLIAIYFYQPIFKGGYQPFDIIIFYTTWGIVWESSIKLFKIK